MDTIEALVQGHKSYFEQGETKSLSFRKMQLSILKSAIKKNEKAIMEALEKDLNKSAFEAYETEIGIIFEEIGFMLKNLDRLSKPRRVKTPITQFISSSKIYQEPYGVVLIMSPWNYPFHLAMAPLIGAMAAGNCTLIKPSNYSPNTSAIIRKIITENFNEGYISVVEGDRKVNHSLLEQKFDYIFFTGSVSVGKTVMTAAAKNLTPVTLELGGKSPCIVDHTAQISLAAKRIAWGKFLNSGQTCVAPDYILVHESMKEQLVQELKISIRQLYGEEPIKHPDYPKIINQKHIERLQGLILSGKVIYGGHSNSLTQQMEPTIIDDVSWDSPIMKEEIFGPILPILTYSSLRDVVNLVNQRPKPLALYYFTRSKKNEQYILHNISSGGGCINDTIVHIANSNMAFGGVGESGMGSYHGEASFRTFSHGKGILKKSNLIDIPLRYSPYKNHLQLLKKVLK